MKFRTGIRFRLFVSFLSILLILFSLLWLRTARNLESSLEEIIESELDSDLRYAWHEYFSVAEQFRSSLQESATSPQVKEFIQGRDAKGLTDLANRYRKSQRPNSCRRRERRFGGALRTHCHREPGAWGTATGERHRDGLVGAPL